MKIEIHKPPKENLPAYPFLAEYGSGGNGLVLVVSYNHYVVLVESDRKGILGGRDGHVFDCLTYVKPLPKGSVVQFTV